MTEMKARVRLWTSVVVAVLFFIWAGLVLASRWNELPELEFNTFSIVLIVLLAWMVVGLNSMMVEFSATRVGNGVGFIDSQRIGFVVSFINYFMPFRVGLVVRVAFYARLAGQDPLRFSAALVTASLVVQLVSAVALVLVLAHVRAARWPLGTLTALVFSAFMVMFLLSKAPPLRAANKLAALWARLHDGTRLLVAGGGHPLLVIALLSGGALLLVAGRYIAGVTLLQGSLTADAALAMAAAAGLSSLVAVTFGGLGVREAAVVLVGRMCGVPVEMCLMLALVDRVLVSVALAVLGVPSMVSKNKVLNRNA